MTDNNKDAATLFQKNLPQTIRFCQKLAMLEREWPGLVGAEYARRSMIVGCGIEEGCAHLTIHAESAAVATSMGPLKTRLPRALKTYLQVDSVKVQIKVGKLKKRETAKPPLPAYKRRAPVLISEETLRVERERARAQIEDPELAEAMARLRAVIKRLQAR